MIPAKSEATSKCSGTDIETLVLAMTAAAAEAGITASSGATMVQSINTR